MAEFDPYARSYSEHIDDVIGVFGKNHDFFVQRKVAILLDAIATIGDPIKAKVIDVGCGVGLIHKYLRGEVADIVGVDVSEASLQEAADANPTVTYRHYDGHRLPVPDASFDCAFAICVMHHVPVAQWPFFVGDMARVLKPGGLAIVIEHNPMNPATRWVVGRSELDKNATLLMPSVLREMFRATGLQQVAAHHFQFTPFSSPIFRKLDTALGWLPLGTQYFVHGQSPDKQA
jgi:ubiquinone/menaquinone biosynthesis C-methylase UbiE